MALTVTKVFQTALRDRFMHVYTVDFDSSYPTGGEALAPADLGFAATNDPEFHVTPHAKGGYVFEYDHTAQKLLAYRQKDPAAAGGADIPLPQVSDTTDLSLLTGVRVTAFGKYRP